MEVGQLYVKIAGRDAGRECLIVEKISGSVVLIDGNTRRRKCNIQHLEWLNKKADIKSGASHEDVIKALELLGVRILTKAPAREQKAKVPQAVSPKLQAKADKKEKKAAKKAPAKKVAKKK